MMNRYRIIFLALTTLVLLLSTIMDAQGTELDLGDNFNIITNTITTPHIPWAKPLSSGPIRTMFIVPRFAAREVVEMTQRVAMDHDAVLTYTADTLGHPGVIHIKGAHKNDVIKALNQKLSYPWDIIIIGHVDFAIFPESIQKRILDLVEAGTPLLYVFPDTNMENRLTGAERVPRPLFEQTLPLNAVRPYSQIPDISKSLDENVRIYQKGKGKVALVTWPRTKPYQMSCLTPDMPMPHYEYHQALLAELVMHMTGWRDKVTLVDTVQDKNELSRVVWILHVCRVIQ